MSAPDAPSTPPTAAEAAIASGYRSWRGVLYALIPLGVALFADVKWVLAAGFLVMAVFLNNIDARLYELTVRARRPLD